jgi:hypothetical protein
MRKTIAVGVALLFARDGCCGTPRGDAFVRGCRGEVEPASSDHASSAGHPGHPASTP